LINFRSLCLNEEDSESQYYSSFSIYLYATLAKLVKGIRVNQVAWWYSNLTVASTAMGHWDTCPLHFQQF